jgi:excisionase family DNA binding protein
MTEKHQASSTDPLMTVEEVAQRLAVSTRTVRRLIDDYVLVGIKIGGSVRVDPRALAMLIENATKAQTAGTKHPLLDAQRGERS